MGLIYSYILHLQTSFYEWIQPKYSASFEPMRELEANSEIRVLDRLVMSIYFKLMRIQ